MNTRCRGMGKGWSTKDVSGRGFSATGNEDDDEIELSMMID